MFNVFNGENKKLKTNIKKMEEDLGLMHHERLHLLHQLSADRGNLRKSLEENKKLKGTVRSLDKCRRDSQDYIKKLKDEKESMQSLVQQRQREYRELHEEFKKLYKEHEELKEKLNAD